MNKKIALMRTLINVNMIKTITSCIYNYVISLNHWQVCKNDPYLGNGAREHPRILYEIRHEIAQPLKILFETLYNTGMLPSDWRSANITAIYKKNKKELYNYRLVNLTSIVCKVIESTVRDFIMEHFLIHGF